jgi:hypothetical protein
LLGKIEQISSRQYDGGDLLYFSPNEDGSNMRVSIGGRAQGLRARDFDLFTCQTFVVTGQCPSDYVFVATAIGEGAFDASRQDVSAE